MKDLVEITIDDETAKLLDLIADAKTYDDLRLAQLAGADADSFGRFLIETGQNKNNLAKKLPSMAPYLTASAKSGTDFTCILSGFCVLHDVVS